MAKSIKKSSNKKSASKSAPKDTISKKLNFKGNTLEFWLGVVLSIILYSSIIPTPFYLLILAFLLIGLYAFQKQINEGKPQEKWFVFIISSQYGFLIGWLLLNWMENHKKLYDWIVPITIILLLVGFIIGILISSLPI